MYTKLLLPALGGLALARAQGAPPPPQTLTSTMSGVLPIAPTPFPGVETLEGAIVYDGNPVIGFTGPGGNASVQSGLPQATYEAVLPSTNFDNLTGSTITGSVTATTGSGGTGVLFTVNFTGFPSEAMYGPFVYHVHALAVPANGNCSATMGHLDPTDRGELYACEVAAPQTCQAGDLAGKHGNITSTSFYAQYTDLYLSTDPSSPYYFGDKSIVIHSTNTTRLTCANFVMMSSNSTSSTNGTSTATGTSGSSATGATMTPTVSAQPYTGAATSGFGFAGAAALAFAAFLL